MDSKRCERCKVQILQTDFPKGLATVVSGKFYCRRCVPSDGHQAPRNHLVLVIGLALAAAILLLLLLSWRR